MHNFNFWDWIQAIWFGARDIWILGVICWAIVIWDAYDRRKKEKVSQENLRTSPPWHVVVAPGQSVVGVQPIHPHQGLNTDHWWNRPLRLRNLPFRKTQAG
jgi:hypothetical protein